MRYRYEFAAATLLALALTGCAEKNGQGNKIIVTKPEVTSTPPEQATKPSLPICVTPNNLPLQRAFSDFHPGLYSNGLYFDSFNNLGQGAYLLQLEPNFQLSSLVDPIPTPSFGMNTVLERSGDSFHITQGLATEGRGGNSITSTWDGDFDQQAQKCNTLITRWNNWQFTEILWNGVKQTVRIVQRAVPTPTIPPAFRNPKVG